MNITIAPRVNPKGNIILKHSDKTKITPDICFTSQKGKKLRTPFINAITKRITINVDAAV